MISYWLFYIVFMGWVYLLIEMWVSGMELPTKSLAELIWEWEQYGRFLQ